MPAWFWLITQTTTPHIESWWPTSVAGWITSVVAVFALGSQLVALWRADKRPILAKLEEAKTYFTREMGRLEKDFTDKVSDQRQHIDQMLDDYHRTVTGEINGWAKRFQDDHTDVERHEIVLGDHAGKLIESRADRDQLNRRQNETASRIERIQQELSIKIDRNMEETRQLERTMSDKLQATERRILDAISGHQNRHPR